MPSTDNLKKKLLKFQKVLHPWVYITMDKYDVYANYNPQVTLPERAQMYMGGGGTEREREHERLVLEIISFVCTSLLYHLVHFCLFLQEFMKYPNNIWCVYTTGVVLIVNYA